MALKCPIKGCNNEVTLVLENGKLYWIDTQNPSHKGLVEELKSPIKEEFLGYAYEKGILKKENAESNQKNSNIIYTTQNIKASVHSTQDLPLEEVLLIVIGIVYLIFSLLNLKIFSSPILYILSAYFIILGVSEYFKI